MRKNRIPGDIDRSGIDRGSIDRVVRVVRRAYPLKVAVARVGMDRAVSMFLLLFRRGERVVVCRPVSVP